MPHAIGVDKLLLQLNADGSNPIEDVAGNRLDGEWTNPTSTTQPSSSTYPSGDGTPGGDFLFRLNVLPGDADLNGAVGSSDLSIVLADFGKAGDWSDGDFDGNGVVGSSDLSTVLANFGKTLPMTDFTAADVTTASTGTDDTVSHDTVTPIVTINQPPVQADPTNASPVNAGPTLGQAAVSQAKGKISWNAVIPTVWQARQSKSTERRRSNIGGPYRAAAGGTFSASYGSLAAGSHDYTITATDKAGNVASLSGTFSIAPNAGPTLGSVVVSQTKGKMSWNAVDADGVASATIQIDGHAVSNVGGPYTAASGVNFSVAYGR